MDQRDVENWMAGERRNMSRCRQNVNQIEATNMSTYSTHWHVDMLCRHMSTRRHLTLATSLQYQHKRTYRQTCSKSWNLRDLILLPLSHKTQPNHTKTCWKQLASGRFTLFHVIFFCASRGGTATPPGSLRLLEWGWNKLAEGISPGRRPRGPELWRPRPRAATLKEFCGSAAKVLGTKLLENGKNYGKLVFSVTFVPSHVWGDFEESVNWKTTWWHRV